jgi:hypothetical protein
MNPIQRAVAAQYYFDGRHDSDRRLNVVHSSAFLAIPWSAVHIMNMALVDESAVLANYDIRVISG